jgi:DNA-directed RNA polymerase specialized sigma24 family protein
MSKAALVQMLGRWTGSHSCDPDSSFLARFLAERDEDAFAALVHRHGPLVYGTCLRILGNRTDTDDAFQAVFFVLARRARGRAREAARVEPAALTRTTGQARDSLPVADLRTIRSATATDQPWARLASADVFS